jgi:hypothetical protein
MMAIRVPPLCLWCVILQCSLTYINHVKALAVATFTATIIHVNMPGTPDSNILKYAAELAL